jgi:hypothetical protein
MQNLLYCVLFIGARGQHDNVVSCQDYARE